MKKLLSDQTFDEYKRNTISFALKLQHALTLEELLEFAFDKGYLRGQWSERNGVDEYNDPC